MRYRRLLVLPCAALLVVPTSAAALPHGPAAVRLTECTPAIEQVQRSATFEGEMRAVRGASRLLMKFTLKLLANLTDPRGGDGMDRLINGLSKIAPAA